MANFPQKGAPVFVVSAPMTNQGVYYTSPSPGSIYPPMYTSVQQQQQPSASCKYSVLLGRTSVIVLGVVLLVCGAISQAGASVGFRFFAGLSNVGVGIWCGCMFFAAGAVAIVAAHHETKKLIIGTIFTSALAVIASITQLTVAGVGLARDVYYYSCSHWCYSYDSHYHPCPCYYEDWASSAVGANIAVVFAACLALIGSVWLLVAVCVAFRRKQTSFQVAATPYQFIPIASQPNIYQGVRTEQMNSTNFRQVQQQQQQKQQRQQLMPLNCPHPNTINLPMVSQVGQMPVASFPLQMTTTSTIPNQQVVQMPVASIPPQTTAASTIPNQQVLQLPVQFILNALQHHFDEEIRNRQMLSIPTQFVAQLQQPLSLNNLPANIIDSETSSQLHEHNEATKNDDRDAEKSLCFHPTINTGEMDSTA